MIGFAIIIFPSVIAMINGVMQPTVTATSAMVTDADKAIAEVKSFLEQSTSIQEVIFVCFDLENIALYDEKL